jgi:hypothetical protein
VTVDDALRAAVGLLRRRADAVLPYYALLAATGDVARLPLIVGLVVVYVVLSSTGRLDPLIDELAALNPELLSPENPAGLPPALGDRLATTLLSPTVAGALVIAALLAVACYVLARGVTRAAAFSAVEAALDDREPLAAGVDGIDRWRTFAGLVLVRWGLLVGAGLPLVVAVGAVGAETLGTTPGAAAALDRATVLAVLAALVGLVVTAGAVLVVLALLAFAGPAVVVDDVGVRRAVGRSARVPADHPGGFVLYVVVVVTVSVTFGVVAGVLGVVGVGRLAALASAFLVTPFLDGVAVALYAGWVTDASEEDGDGGRESGTGEQDDVGPTEADESGFAFGVAPGAAESAPARPVTERPPGETQETDSDEPATPGEGQHESEGVGTGASVGSRGGERTPGVRGALRDGVAELGGFLRRDWGYVAVAAAVLAGGVAAGWGATAGYGVRIGTPDDPATVFGTVPVGPFVEIAVNNWLVATSAGFSGLFAGLPTAGTLLFNGLLVGAVAGVVDPDTFLAFVGPHGVVELPAIAVAGGVGLRLGHVAWGAWRGSRPRSAVVNEIGRAWRIVVGLAVVFVVAGFVEAFVTPQVAAAVLG